MMANNGCNVVPNSFGSKSLWTYMEFQSHQMWPTARQANGPLAVDDQCGSTQKRIAVWSTHVMLNKLAVMDVRSLPFTDRLLYCIICCSYDFTVTLVIGYIRIISPLYAGGQNPWCNRDKQIQTCSHCALGDGPHYQGAVFLWMKNLEKPFENIIR